MNQWFLKISFSFGRCIGKPHTVLILKRMTMKSNLKELYEPNLPHQSLKKSNITDNKNNKVTKNKNNFIQT